MNKSVVRSALLQGTSHNLNPDQSLSQTFHTHHAGRALYTLVRPSSTPGQAPEIKHVTMGEALEKGEVRQLVVEGGWWKASEIPPEDLKDGTDEEKVGCLISEVVVPGTLSEEESNRCGDCES